MPLASLDSTSDIVLLFAGAGLVLYIAARAAVDALTSATDPSPGKLAVGHWLAIAWPAVLATAAGRSEIGVGIALATSVAALAMVMGVLICISADAGGARLRARAWPFVVPAALLALLAGFSGSLTWWHALMLLGLGACVLGVWNGRVPDDEPTLATQPPTHSAEPSSGFEVLPPPVDAAPQDQAAPTSIPPSPTSSSPVMTEGQWRAAQLVLAVALAAAGGWLAYRATTVADDRTRVATSGLIAAAVVAPLLVLPMLGTGAIAAHHGRLPAVTAAIVGVVLLNLCLLLPTVVLTHYARQVVVDWEQIQPVLDSSAATTTESADGEDVYQLRPMPFPLAVWRVDTVLLIVLGLLLVPVSLGRLTLKKPEGLALAVIYAVYLVISTALAIRM